MISHQIEKIFQKLVLVPSSAGEEMNAALSTIYCILHILLRYFQVLQLSLHLHLYLYLHRKLYMNTYFLFIFVPSLILMTIFGELSTRNDWFFIIYNSDDNNLFPHLLDVIITVKMISALHLLLDVCRGSLPIPSGGLSQTFRLSQ